RPTQDRRMRTMISTVYQLVNNMEANYAGKVAIQYYDEAKGGVVSIRYGQYAQDIRRAAGLLLHRDPDIRGKKVCLLARNGYDFLVNMRSEEHRLNSSHASISYAVFCLT